MFGRWTALLVMSFILLPLSAVAKEDAKAAAAKPAKAAAKKSAKSDKAPKLDMKAIEAAMKKSDCFACHSVQRKVVGPAYIEIAKKYKDDKETVTKLVAKVKGGGQGVWGAVPMTPHPTLKDEDVVAMVRWVLAQK